MEARPRWRGLLRLFQVTANDEFVEGTLPEWLGQVPAAIPAIREWTKDGATYIKP